MESKALGFFLFINVALRCSRSSVKLFIQDSDIDTSVFIAILIRELWGFYSAGWSLFFVSYDLGFILTWNDRWSQSLLVLYFNNNCLRLLVASKSAGWNLRNCLICFHLTCEMPNIWKLNLRVWCKREMRLPDLCSCSSSLLEARRSGYIRCYEHIMF